MTDAEYYRQKAIEMRAQAARAQSPYLQSTYEHMAANWERLADTLAQPGTLTKISKDPQ